MWSRLFKKLNKMFADLFAELTIANFDIDQVSLCAFPPQAEREICALFL